MLQPIARKLNSQNQARGRRKMTQEERLENHLKEFRHINPLEAWSALGIYRLSAVVHTLRRKGLVITTQTTNVYNKFGEKCHVAKYILE